MMPNVSESYLYNPVFVCSPSHLGTSVLRAVEGRQYLQLFLYISCIDIS